MKNVSKSKKNLNLPASPQKPKARGSILREVIKKPDAAANPEPLNLEVRPEAGKTQTETGDITPDQIREVTFLSTRGVENSEENNIMKAPPQKRASIFAHTSNPSMTAASSDSTQIRVVSRFRPLNSVETVK